jgi:tetratricopeptide (TPR) repeat protein
MNLADALNNVGLVYRSMNRDEDAEDAYSEALSIYHGLDSRVLGKQLRHMAGILTNLASLYMATQRETDAESAYLEALAIQQRLFEIDAGANSADFAEALHNLATLYLHLQRISEARGHSYQAYVRLEPLWSVNPKLYGNQMARICLVRAMLAERQEDACDSARRGFATASDPGLKQVLQTVLDQCLCGPGDGVMINSTD